MSTATKSNQNFLCSANKDVGEKGDKDPPADQLLQARWESLDRQSKAVMNPDDCGNHLGSGLAEGQRLGRADGGIVLGLFGEVCGSCTELRARSDAE